MSQQARTRNPEGIEKLNRFVTDLKSVGLIEGISLNGRVGRYFLIEGQSWNKACCRLGETAEPSFIAWHENDFFDFLKSRFINVSKQHITNPIAVNDGP